MLKDNKTNLNDESKANREKDPAGYTVTLKELLGKDGVELYKKAIEEERNSKEFRNAVFLKAVSHSDGPEWGKRMVLWVAGPSASGKTHSSEQVINEIIQKGLIKTKDDNQNKGNYVVAIDGGIEREISQMRQLVLQVAIQKGYTGIQDLHKNTHLKMKGLIQKAALQTNDLSLVIPNTFSNPLTTLKIRKFDKMDNIKQIFSEVVAANREDHTREQSKAAFKETVARQGNSRAWKSSDFDPKEITFNNFNLPESKEYQQKYFDAGKNGSERAKAFYLFKNNDPIYIRIENDYMYANKETGEKYKPGEKAETIGLSFRDYHKWEKEQKGKMLDERTPLSEWLKDQKPASTIIKINAQITAPTETVDHSVDELRKAKATGIRISRFSLFHPKSSNKNDGQHDLKRDASLTEDSLKPGPKR